MGLRILSAAQEELLTAQELLTKDERAYQRVMTPKELELITELGALTDDELNEFKRLRRVAELKSQQQKLALERQRINDKAKKVTEALEVQLGKG